MSFDWFKSVFGFREPDSFEECKSRFKVEENENGVMLSTAENKWLLGKFSTPSLQQLQNRYKEIDDTGCLRVDSDRKGQQLG